MRRIVAGAATRPRADGGRGWPPSRASIAQRRASSHSGSSPSVAAISRVGRRRGRACRGSRRSAGVEPLAERPQRARVQRRARRRAARRAAPRRGGLGQHGLGAGDRGAHGQAGVGEGGVDDHARRRRAARGCAGTARGRRRRAGAGRPARRSGCVSAIASKPSRAVAARGGDAQAVLVVDQPAQPGTNGGVVVDEHNVHPDSVAPRPAPVAPSGDAPHRERGSDPYGSTRPRRIA